MRIQYQRLACRGIDRPTHSRRHPRLPAVELILVVILEWRNNDLEGYARAPPLHPAVAPLQRRYREVVGASFDRLLPPAELGAS